MCLGENGRQGADQALLSPWKSFWPCERPGVLCVRTDLDGLLTPVVPITGTCPWPLTRTEAPSRMLPEDTDTHFQISREEPNVRELTVLGRQNESLAKHIFFKYFFLSWGFREPDPLHCGKDLGF